MADVSLHAIVKSFGSVRALNEIDLDIEHGELVALLGPSGCGKTTLLRMIAGLTAPDQGRILIGGEDVTNVPTRQRPIGMVFQHYALFPNLNVRRNIAFPLEIRRQSKHATSTRVSELLELIGLSGLGSRFPHELSGGQQQRVAVARALAPEPQVLLLDEPLGALDATIRTDLRDEIRRIQQRVGITAVFVTHDQSEAMAVADRVAVMSSGRILECAPPVEIYDRPQSKFAAMFVGARNALELRVGPDRLVRWGEAFALPAPEQSNGAVVAAFRPEDVEIVDVGGIEGEVEVVVFLGSTTRVHLDVRGVRVAADLQSPAAGDIRVGKQVRVRVNPEGVRLYPA